MPCGLFTNAPGPGSPGGRRSCVWESPPFRGGPPHGEPEGSRDRVAEAADTRTHACTHARAQLRQGGQRRGPCAGCGGGLAAWRVAAEVPGERGSAPCLRPAEPACKNALSDVRSQSASLGRGLRGHSPAIPCPSAEAAERELADPGLGRASRTARPPPPPAQGPRSVRSQDADRLRRAADRLPGAPGASAPGPWMRPSQLRAGARKGSSVRGRGSC